MTDDIQRMLGLRVRAAREAKSMTQEELSARLGFKDRQSLSAIEQGLRSVKATELVAFAKELCQELDYFTDPFNVAGEAQFCWRVADFGVDLASLEEKIGPLLGLYRWLNKERSSVLKQALRISLRSSMEDAQNAGRALAAELGASVSPAHSLTSTIEARLGISVLYVDLPATVSGLTCVLSDCVFIVVNRKLDFARRTQDLAVGLFYALAFDALEATREAWFSPDGFAAGRVEKLALKFALGLLVPAKGLSALIESNATAEAAGAVAQLLGVTPGLLLRELPAFEDQFKKRKSKKSVMAAKVRPGAAPQTAPLLFSSSLVERLNLALHRGELSIRKAAKLTGLTLDSLKDLFTSYGIESPIEL
jgi:transcriptional regulator with XRE-family HTH domain